MSCNLDACILGLESWPEVDDIGHHMGQMSIGEVSGKGNMDALIMAATQDTTIHTVVNQSGRGISKQHRHVIKVEEDEKKESPGIYEQMEEGEPEHSMDAKGATIADLNEVASVDDIPVYWTSPLKTEYMVVRDINRKVMRMKARYIPDVPRVFRIQARAANIEIDGEIQRLVVASTDDVIKMLNAIINDKTRTPTTVRTQARALALLSLVQDRFVLANQRLVQPQDTQERPVQSRKKLKGPQDSDMVLVETLGDLQIYKGPDGHEYSTMANLVSIIGHSSVINCSYEDKSIVFTRARVREGSSGRPRAASILNMEDTIKQLRFATKKTNKGHSAAVRLLSLIQERIDSSRS